MNTEEILIGPCGRERIPQVIRLVRTVWETVSDKAWFAVDEDGYLETVCQEETTLLWGAFSEGRLVAALIVVRPVSDRYLDAYLPEKTLDVAYMDIVAVHSDFRGRQLQQRLMRAAEEPLRNMGVDYLQCTVHPRNVYSRRNILSLGYQELAEVRLYGGYPRVVLGKRLLPNPPDIPCA